MTMYKLLLLESMILHVMNNLPIKVLNNVWMRELFQNVDFCNHLFLFRIRKTFILKFFPN